MSLRMRHYHSYIIAELRYYIILLKFRVVFSRSVRLLLLRDKTQHVGTSGGRGRENRTENEIADDDKTAKQSTTGSGEDFRQHQHRLHSQHHQYYYRSHSLHQSRLIRHHCSSGRREEDRTEEADQLGTATRQQRQ